MQQELSHNQWSGKTDGTPWMQRALIGMYRFLPLRLLYGIMALVVPFYMLFSHKGYLACYRFFRQRMRFRPLKAFAYVYRNHFAFGQVILDRFAVYAGKQFRFVLEGAERFEQLAQGEKGFVMLSSHVGCYELAGYSLTSDHKRLHALVYAGESATIMQQRSRVLSGHNMEMVPVMPDLSHLFALNAALDNGDIVSMPADRLFGSRKAAKCTFFGDMAKFPQGAFALARAKEVPLLAVFVMKERAKQYRIIVKEVSDAQQFSSALEETVRRYPTQWFNYFDFWAEK